MTVAEKKFATTPKGILSGIRRVAPDVEISINWQEDPHFEWDGDGPDPRASGYIPHDVTVRAEIRTDDDILIFGEEYIGGVYEKEYEQSDDIHGYFPGMVNDALAELYKKAAGPMFHPSRKHWDPRKKPERHHQYLQQIAAARVFVKRSMRAIYEVEERRRRRNG